MCSLLGSDMGGSVCPLLGSALGGGHVSPILAVSGCCTVFIRALVQLLGTLQEWLCASKMGQTGVPASAVGDL